MNIDTWTKLNQNIKSMMIKNGLTVEDISSEVTGELNELAIKTEYGWETLFYGNKEAFITVNVDGIDYSFSYVIDTYGDKSYIVNF
jgi:hypothetical protein